MNGSKVGWPSCAVAPKPAREVRPSEVAGGSPRMRRTNMHRNGELNRWDMVLWLGGMVVCGWAIFVGWAVVHFALKYW